MQPPGRMAWCLSLIGLDCLRACVELVRSLWGTLKLWHCLPIPVGKLLVRTLTESLRCFTRAWIFTRSIRVLWYLFMNFHWKYWSKYHWSPWPYICQTPHQSLISSYAAECSNPRASKARLPHLQLAILLCDLQTCKYCRWKLEARILHDANWSWSTHLVSLSEGNVLLQSTVARTRATAKITTVDFIFCLSAKGIQGIWVLVRAPHVVLMEAHVTYLGQLELTMCVKCFQCLNTCKPSTPFSAAFVLKLRIHLQIFISLELQVWQS